MAGEMLSRARRPLAWRSAFLTTTPLPRTIGQRSEGEITRSDAPCHHQRTWVSIRRLCGSPMRGTTPPELPVCAPPITCAVRTLRRTVPIAATFRVAVCAQQLWCAWRRGISVGARRSPGANIRVRSRSHSMTVVRTEEWFAKQRIAWLRSGALVRDASPASHRP